MPLSTFLNQRNPTQLRGLQWLALSETGNFITLTSTSDSGGGATQAWTAGSAVPCRIDPGAGYRAGGSRLTGGLVDERSTHIVTVPAGTPIAVAGRFAITGRGTFEVTATHQQTSEMTREFEVIEVS